MSQAVNNAEEFVYNICHNSFFSLWSYLNPQGKNAGKELCDILVIFDPHIIIFSVKEIKLTDSGNVETGWTRWQRKAIEESVKQIYGAEKWLQSAPHVIRKDGTQGLQFPSLERRTVHRVAVALGGDNYVPLKFGDFEKGFVHVFDRTSLSIILGELNTVADFVEYLIAKENLYSSGIVTLFDGCEEDLLAFYLHKGRDFSHEYNVLVIDDTLWKGFSESEEYKSKKIVDNDSYIWDRLIESLSNDILDENLEFGPTLNDAELAIRTMARETRFSRRLLGKSFREFIDLAIERKVESRIILSQSEVTYVFLAKPRSTDRNYRVAELGGRCFVARGLYQNRRTVIGLATEQPEHGKGYSVDVFYLHQKHWSDNDQEQLKIAQKNFGWFVNARTRLSHEDEYPAA